MVNLFSMKLAKGGGGGVHRLQMVNLFSLKLAKGRGGGGGGGLCETRPT